MKTTFFLLFLFLFSSVHAQETALSIEDSSRIIGHVYKVNAWGSLGIGLGGELAILLARLSPWFGKPDITNQEFDAAQSTSGKDALNALDQLALNIKRPTVDYGWTAVGVQAACAALPFTLFFSERFRKNWDDIVLMLLETNAVATCIFQFSPLGPFFQSKYRPLVYSAVTQAERDATKSGDNRNSFFSGHTNSATACTYFMAKVYCDYHPEIEGWGKIGIYALATLPPAFMGYMRLIAQKHFPSDILTGMVIGGVCGITIPEIHRIAGKTVKFGAYVSPTGTGMSLTYNFK